MELPRKTWTLSSGTPSGNVKPMFSRTFSFCSGENDNGFMFDSDIETRYARKNQIIPDRQGLFEQK